MTAFQSLNVSASALTAQRLRMDVVSSNLANMDTTRAKQVNGEWLPYRRKMVSLQSKGESFSSILNSKMSGSGNVGNGVKVTKITEDNSDFNLVYDPTNPDANAEGYVQKPNVDPLKEMVDLVSSTRSYEANVTAMNASKGMLMKALEIGK
ncbi:MULTISPECIES: flagellar basal body rod protein FlgC [Bacillus]|jgi:flagellar basal-body rod protein FlgC|uniref:Flagellar basal-body rod protein FlgC n=1 Tax=Bacillus mojavensis TaxID=72360 RepID=A0AAP3CRF7_BACMO|nr:MULTISPECIES: flagellar basal body rod protein FlgC [Bacillus]MCC2931470.1 flagellar basal body rod protein FlgC [Bacillus sp. LBG-1-113]MCY8103879.1 flagellar basal body rod protein FlgC [Bacillus mojavensis]MCY8480953.1 flagellar basal body rod protein FlgC [Bacillus mojavensis]MCY8509881.1 flagellar basal body rod protein FlgC [Bacillus mojavensis]MCY9092523.1 flagellar basal body rod protein FlgC [Bacillus mojavensis]